IPLTRNFCIESHVSPASAGLFERGFISRGARNTRRQKFSSVVRAPSGTSFIHEAAIDGKIFACHPSCRKPLLEAPPDGTAREPSKLVGGANRLLLPFDNETSQPIFDDFGDGASVERDHRCAAGHCFNQH